MKLIAAFFRLIRWPNLLYIVLTQLLFYFCIVQRVIIAPDYSGFRVPLFIYLIVASVLIAAAGYIINDYFDRNIDQVNKPTRLVIDKVIKRRWAIVWHILLSLAGTGICFYIDLAGPTNWLGFANLICVLLLFGYSVTLKKKLFFGNLLISALTAWVIIVVYLCYSGSILQVSSGTRTDPNIYIRFTRMTLLYAGFAFVISLIREVVKDMEDMEGDLKYGCRTLPVVWGIPATKVFAAVWIIVLICTLSIVQFYVLQFGWWWSAVYCIFLIVVPLLLILKQLYRAQIPADYHRLSMAIKWVILTGILSMIFFRIYL